MADPFEVRMRFTSQLQHLNASVTSAQKAANYALRFRDNDMDLHSCIIEQLEKVGAVALMESACGLLTAQEQHEQPSEHHVLHRTSLRCRTAGKSH